MKILLADDSKIILDRLEKMFEDNKKIEIVGKAENSLMAYDKIMKLKPDVVVLDIKMPGGDGIELLKKIKRERPEIKAIMLTNYNQSIYKTSCLKAGAEYFLDKSNEFEKVVEICESLAKNNS